MKRIENLNKVNERMAVRMNESNQVIPLAIEWFAVKLMIQPFGCLLPHNEKKEKEKESIKQLI